MLKCTAVKVEYLEREGDSIDQPQHDEQPDPWPSFLFMIPDSLQEELVMYLSKYWVSGKTLLRWGKERWGKMDEQLCRSTRFGTDPELGCLRHLLPLQKQVYGCINLKTYTWDRLCKPDYLVLPPLSIWQDTAVFKRCSLCSTWPESSGDLREQANTAPPPPPGPEQLRGEPAQPGKGCGAEWHSLLELPACCTSPHASACANFCFSRKQACIERGGHKAAFHLLWSGKEEEATSVIHFVCWTLRCNCFNTGSLTWPHFPSKAFLSYPPARNSKRYY